MAKGSDGNSAPSVKGNEATGTYVKVAGLNIDLTQGFVEPVKGVFVSDALAGFVRQVEPSTEETIGKYVKPASPRSLASYDVALYVRAQGTSGQLTRSINYKGQRIVEYYNYLRPTAKYAGTVMQAVAFAKELIDRGVPVMALTIVYPTPGARLRKPRVLYVKGIWAYYVRYHSLAGVRLYPEVRFYFTRHMLGLKKKTPYLFDLIILYSSKPLQKPATRQELVEQAMAQTPPPQLVVAQPQPRAQASDKYANTYVRSVEAQPEAPTAQAQPAKPEAQQVEGKRKFVTQVEPQPEDTNGPLKELEETYRRQLEIDGVAPEEQERLLKKFRERWKNVTF